MCVGGGGGESKKWHVKSIAQILHVGILVYRDAIEFVLFYYRVLIIISSCSRDNSTSSLLQPRHKTRVSEFIL